MVSVVINLKQLAQSEGFIVLHTHRGSRKIRYFVVVANGLDESARKSGSPPSWVEVGYFGDFHYWYADKLVLGILPD